MYATKQRCDPCIRGYIDTSLKLPDLDPSSNGDTVLQDSGHIENLRKVSVSSAGVHSPQ